jgi:GNAT superfamily N-acetyltransferase
VDGADEAVGYVAVDAVDGCAHVEQISVVPAHSGKGIVRALLDEVERWAVSCQLAAVPLTTFDGVAWNRLLYEHLGFATLGDGELSAGLRARREAETAHGLDPTTRVYMRRALRRAGRDAG